MIMMMLMTLFVGGAAESDDADAGADAVDSSTMGWRLLNTSVTPQSPFSVRGPDSVRPREATAPEPAHSLLGLAKPDEGFVPSTFRAKGAGLDGLCHGVQSSRFVHWASRMQILGSDLGAQGQKQAIGSGDLDDWRFHQ